MIATTTRFKTHNDLADVVRLKGMIALLNQDLADLSYLYSQSKQAHCNVRGMNFIALHKLFDDLAEDLPHQYHASVTMMRAERFGAQR